MLSSLLCLLLTGPPPSLAAISSTLADAPAWTASFEQRYVPAGFDEGSGDRGSLTLASPNLLRFDYDGDPPRIFAFDGSVARMVDLGSATCDAVRLDGAARGSLPLAVLVDAASAERVFEQHHEGRTLVLVPREPSLDVATIRIDQSADGLPARFTVIDATGNHNEFTFVDWKRTALPPAGSFRPSLPGASPCQPADR